MDIISQWGGTQVTVKAWWLLNVCLHILVLYNIVYASHTECFLLKTLNNISSSEVKVLADLFEIQILTMIVLPLVQSCLDFTSRLCLGSGEVCGNLE